MPEPLLEVGVDACVLIEAVLLGTSHPSGVVLEAAARGAFSLLLIENVEEEARRALRSRAKEDHLDTLLRRCSFRWIPACSAEEARQSEREFGPLLKHLNDAPIAWAVKRAQPDVFISSNHDHWRPSLRTALGGVAVMRPREFLEKLGLPAPPKPRR